MVGTYHMKTDYNNAVSVGSFYFLLTITKKLGTSTTILNNLGTD